MSDSTAAGGGARDHESLALLNGPESRFVVEAIEAVLDGDLDAAVHLIGDGADRTSPATMAHRLDVAGRALARDDLTEGRSDQPLALPGIELPATAERIWHAWADGRGLEASVDLLDDQVSSVDVGDQLVDALLVLTALVERSGFPPQVVV